MEKALKSGIPLRKCIAMGKSEKAYGSASKPSASKPAANSAKPKPMKKSGGY